MKKITLFLSETSATLILIFSFSLLFAIAVCWCFCTQESCGTYGNFVGGAVGCLIAIANAILLYSTLKSQQYDTANSKKIAEREQFENTFFRMLENLGKIVDCIHCNYSDLNQVAILEEKSCKGQEFFDVFSQELGWMNYNFLKEKNYDTYSSNTLNQDEISYDLKEEEYDGFEEEVKYQIFRSNLYRRHKCYWINTMYGINKERWKYIREQSAEDRTEECYKLFKNVWFPIYEHYIRYISYVLRYIIMYAPQKTEEKPNLYFDIFRAQLTQNEGKLISLHAKIDKDLGKLLEQARILQK